jgi:hypothetical protein
MPQYATNSSEAIKVLVPARRLMLFFFTSVLILWYDVVSTLLACVLLSLSGDESALLMALGVPVLTKVQAPLVVSAASSSWRGALQ